ncbi:helix-turn-helix domain-containing protein [Paenibacillus sp. FSL K6-1318]|uniref:helix-turn-helix domain-containing protein n=1 Tax=Paenibacillus sp. FSL K6-1318 TaxID=2975291 RepID=UPI0030EE5257
MEKKNTRGSTKEDLTRLLFQARAGEEQATLKILELYYPEMEKLAETIRMPKEDTIQSLRLELIEFIKLFPTQ